MKLTNEFIEKKVNIFGTGGSGKTVFSKELWEAYKNPMAYDINGDFAKCKGGIAYNPRDIRGEFMGFLKAYLKISETKKIDALFFDDCDGYIDYEIMNEIFFTDLVIRQRNKYKVSLVFISKRPQNIPTKIVENSQTLVIFKIEGVNALKRLQDIDIRMVKLLDDVYKKPFSYIIKEEGQPPTLHKPVKFKK